MSYSVTVTPLEGDGKTKGIANIHIGRKLSATVFVKENEEGELYVQRPGYELKKKEGEDKPVWNNYLNTVGEGSLKKLNQAVLDEYNRMRAGGERNTIESLDIDKIEIVSVVPKLNDKNKYERGFATVRINDEFILNTIKVLEGKFGLYTSFPSSYDKENDKEHKFIEAFGDVKKEIDKRIVEAYEKVKEKEVTKEEVKEKKTENKKEDKKTKNANKKEKTR